MPSRTAAVRNVAALVLFIVGGALLALGILGRARHAAGRRRRVRRRHPVVHRLALGAALVMPPVLRLVGRLFGRSATARLAAENALRYPERSSRMAIGVVMGVDPRDDVRGRDRVDEGGDGGSGRRRAAAPSSATVLDSFAAIMMGLVAVSAVIAGVGLVNLLTIGVVQRRRELGLLRALGVSNGQIRRMVLLEAAHITIAATATGLVLGVRLRLGGRAVAAGVDPDGSGAPRPPRRRSSGRPCRCGRSWRSSWRRRC